MRSQLSDQIKSVIQTAHDALKGAKRRLFMASVVKQLGRGGQRKAEKELGWNRGTIIKGMHELRSGFICNDAFNQRGRKPWECHVPNLEKDIRKIAEPASETDPTFRTTQLYRRLTGKEVRRQLLEEMGYAPDQVPTERTLRRKLTEMGHKPRKVAKSKPIRKIKETNEIFNQRHKINKEADTDEGTVRLSIDTKAVVKIGDLSRGGKSRQGEKASDHDFESECKLTPFGIHRPDTSETYLFFTSGSATADYMVDRLEEIWPNLKKNGHSPHTLVINADNGPENSGSRSQWLKRLVNFSAVNDVTIKLAYYPPYHSKYNPIERVFGVLENNWNGDPLRTKEKALGLAEGMTYKGVHPVVRLVTKKYAKGVKLRNSMRRLYEKALDRLPGLEKWFITITPDKAKEVCSIIEKMV